MSNFALGNKALHGLAPLFVRRHSRLASASWRPVCKEAAEQTPHGGEEPQAEANADLVLI